MVNHNGGQGNTLSAITRQSDTFKETAFWWSNYYSWSMIAFRNAYINVSAYSINKNKCYLAYYMNIYWVKKTTYLRWNYSIIPKFLCNVCFSFWNGMIANKYCACTNSLLFSSTLTKRKENRSVFHHISLCFYRAQNSCLSV